MILHFFHLPSANKIIKVISGKLRLGTQLSDLELIEALLGHPIQIRMI